ncbi:flagellar hook-basal body complex protein [Rhodoplanes sp. TEM]|uniref:Flagellar hook protein FlgE n=1 Tax=Rhodoplanes tepidamans TaxID=200616 RepID=A0ABT5JAR6_RHOTP|nr:MULTISPECIES: flagellar hook-basal body complex protein [Rhodoplanes]MDC7786745.1 flagellar hook-basal body complex protein [Rhodoplanes tepidamans]MDC7983751.1 flagellar hook-basal body complex protein [Rhodoplanes sp. TEM]MDQ0358182.1 flagellar hook protein FlgE [Rhodoplanes tepidamans]
MGIFGALTTSVTGMQAQSFALQNISGNIANAQTTAYKRTDTSFTDLIQDNQPSKQVAGSVMASSRGTNTVQGDIQTSSIGTFMAINGDGYFVVMKPTGMTDNNPIFSGVNQFTRRGDFQPNKDGYLVNGAGYYLMGIPVDSTTGNLTGSVPELLKFKNDFLPAQATTEIQYRANLARYPFTPSHDSSTVGSELLDPVDYSANPIAVTPQAAKMTGSGATLSPDANASLTGTAVLPGTLVNAGTITVNGNNVVLTAGMTPANVVSAINTAANPAVTATLDASNHLVLQSADAETAITLGGANAALFTELGVSVGTTNPTNLLTQSAVSSGQTLTITIGSNPTLTLTFGPSPNITTMADLNTALATLTGGVASVNSLNGNMTITASSSTDTIEVGGTANRLMFGLQTSSALPSNQTVIGNDLTTFVSQTVGGGAITVYDVSGSSTNIQLRWAKIDSTTLGSGHTDTWNLFYQVNSSATGTDVAWKNFGANFTFDANGQMSPVISNWTLSDVTVDGASLGDITVNFGSGGITQFSDANGNVQVNLLSQNGYAAGSLQTISVNDSGRVTGSYSNGRTIDLAEVTLAKFSGANFLKRIDGGAFEATDQSGEAVYGASGKIVGASLEGANTDIADEFTKLIVTQQAYSANTRVITTSNQMIQDLLNMLR